MNIALNCFDGLGPRQSEQFSGCPVQVGYGKLIHLENIAMGKEID